nr:MAG TPA: hypothetical protein [Caudoviricetes sp.]
MNCACEDLHRNQNTPKVNYHGYINRFYQSHLCKYKIPKYRL